MREFDGNGWTAPLNMPLIDAVDKILAEARPIPTRLFSITEEEFERINVNADKAAGIYR